MISDLESSDDEYEYPYSDYDEDCGDGTSNASASDSPRAGFIPSVAAGVGAEELPPAESAVGRGGDVGPEERPPAEFADGGGGVGGGDGPPPPPLGGGVAVSVALGDLAWGRFAWAGARPPPPAVAALALALGNGSDGANATGAASAAEGAAAAAAAAAAGAGAAPPTCQSCGREAHAPLSCSGLSRWIDGVRSEPGVMVLRWDHVAPALRRRAGEVLDRERDLRAGEAAAVAAAPAAAGGPPFHAMSARDAWYALRSMRPPPRRGGGRGDLREERALWEERFLLYRRLHGAAAELSAAGGPGAAGADALPPPRPAAREGASPSPDGRTCPPPSEEEEGGGGGHCGICLEGGLPPGDMSGAACGHLFCSVCWGAYVESEVLRGPDCVRATCPVPGCEVALTEDDVRRAAPGLLDTFASHRLRALVDQSDDMRWCPGPDCGCVAVRGRGWGWALLGGQADRSAASSSCDDCGASFCFRCGEAPHVDPAECAAAAADPPALEPGPGEDDPIKNCPGCSVRIEKNGGCNHMTCKLCRCEFCLICMAKYTSSGHFCGRERRAGLNIPGGVGLLPLDLDYVCAALEGATTDGAGRRGRDRARPNKEGLGSDVAAVLRRKRELDRFAHYRRRFAAHDQGQRYAEGQCDAVANRVQGYFQSTDVQSGACADFITAANARLVDCRRVLKYTYVYAHSMSENEGLALQKELFQQHQERLERFTEELSRETEVVPGNINRVKVIDLSTAADRYMKNIIQFVELGR